VQALTKGVSVNQYEIAVLYHPDLEIDLDKATTKVVKILTDNGGKILNQDNWGKRKLAYDIKGQEYAIYVFYIVELPPESVRKVESSLNITDEVIRFLTVRQDLKAMAKIAAAKADQAKRNAERGVAEEREEPAEFEGEE
jgi:small subunit ribosomal protein S6